MSQSAGRSRTQTRDALAVWVGSRVAVALMAWVGARALTSQKLGTVRGFVDLWDRWDVGLYTKIARWGYVDHGVHYDDCCTAAFFPGMPLALRAVHVVVPSWVAAGLVISLVAGAVGSVALARLTAVMTGADGSRAVAFLVTAPYAVFLFAGYSEALFLGLAVTGWLCCKTDRWALAGVLVALSCTVRITGLFLAVALVLEWWLQRRPVRDLPWVGLPFAALAGFVVWLHAQTGDWLAWSHAQQEGWHRTLTAPWTSLSVSWDAAVASGQRADFAASFGADILAVLVGVLVVVWLCWRRWWSEAVYVGLGVAALATSSYYQSVARSALLWFPAYVLLASAAVRRRWVWPVWCATAVPVMAVMVLAFTSGRWVD